MQYLIIGCDGTDDQAQARRSAFRPDHIEMGEQLRQSGNMWYGAALWDENNQMIGSMLLMDFASEKELRAWLDKEPYVVGKVWEKLEVQRCSVRDPWQYNRPQTWFEKRK